MAAHIRRVQVLTAAVVATWSVSTGCGLAADVSFRNDVMAVLSKAGCNQGTCHGNAHGKGGFKLSLRGDHPAGDYVTLTRDTSGRRVNVFSPEESLLLLKPTMQLAHGGGRRFYRDSREYAILRDWIAGGMPADEPSTPRLERLDVTPREQVVEGSAGPVQLAVTATFSGGSTRDVTGMTVYESSGPVVEITPQGVVQPTNPGRLTEVTVIARYLDQKEPVRLAFLPERPDHEWRGPHEVASDIDRFVFAKLRRLRIDPSAISDDSTFVRRAYLDLLGIPPTGEEARDFVEDDDPHKRAKLIDALLERPEFAEWWALKWSDLLRNEEKTLDRKGVQNFHAWIRHQIEHGTPMNEFARAILSGRGSTYSSPASNFYRALRDPISRAESTAQVFLGVRLKCAKCHNHPFDRWTQDDYYGWANLFARVDYKILENRRRDSNDKHEFKGEQVVYVSSKGAVDDPRTGEPVQPRLLSGMSARTVGRISNPSERSSRFAGSDGLEIRPTAEHDRLEVMAGWVGDPSNRQFARVQVNRIWAALFGRGIVDPVDDFRSTNPPSHPALLEWLTDDFIRHDYDLRHTLRTICRSTVYQLSSEPNQTNADDTRNFSHAIPRRLTAEQLVDSLSQVTAAAVRFNGYPEGLRAGQLPGVQAVNPRYDPPSDGDKFLTVFGKPPRLQACSCERSDETTLAQAFQLVSGPLINDLLTTRGNRIDDLLAADLTDSETIERLYWTALNRPPTTEERTALESQLAESENRRTALQDVLWGLLNSGEFLLRR